MINKYRSGRIHEGKVARDLKEKGYDNIRQSAGSRGAADIYAQKDGRKYYVQVKSGSARMGKEDVDRLRELAKQRRGVAVSVHREDGKSRWKFHGNWSRSK